MPHKPSPTLAVDKLRVAIVGSGSIAELTQQVIDSLPDAAVTHTVPGRHLNPGELKRDDVDVVAVCTANGDHVAHARLALTARKHVVVEKPLTLDIAAGQELLRMGDELGRTITVISQRRWEPYVLAARQAIAAGALGRPVLVECLLRWERDDAYYRASPWRGTEDLDGGVLFNQAIHVLDLMRWLVGPVDSVAAFDATLVRDITAPDTAAAALRFACGALGIVSATVASTFPSPAELNLHFEHGTITLADNRLVTWDVPGFSRPTDESAVGSGSQDPKAIGLLGHRRQWEHIVSALRRGSQPEVSASDGLGTAALVAAIHTSAAAGGRPTRPVVP